MYAYYWVYTAAQIELISCDVPIVVYDKKDKGDRKHSKREMDDLVRRWNEKKEKEKKEGKEFNFSDYVNAPAGAYQNK
jgi:hypothetical protein